MYILEHSEQRLVFRLSSRFGEFIDFLIGLFIWSLLAIFNIFALMFILVAISGGGHSQLQCIHVAEQQAQCTVTAQRSALLDITEQHSVPDVHRVAVEVTRRGFAIYLYGHHSEALFTVYDSREHADAVSKQLNQFIWQVKPTEPTLQINTIDDHWLSSFTTRTGGVVMIILVIVGVIYFRRTLLPLPSLSLRLKAIPIFVLQVLFFSVHVGWLLLRKFQTTTCYLDKIENCCTVKRHHVLSRWLSPVQLQTCPLPEAHLQVRVLKPDQQEDYHLSLVLPNQSIEQRLAHYHAPISAKQQRRLEQQQQMFAQYIEVKTI